MKQPCILFVLWLQEQNVHRLLFSSIQLFIVNKTIDHIMRVWLVFSLWGGAKEKNQFTSSISNGNIQNMNILVLRCSNIIRNNFGIQWNCLNYWGQRVMIQQNWGREHEVLWLSIWDEKNMDYDSDWLLLQIVHVHTSLGLIERL